MPVNGKKTRPLAPTVMDARLRRNERLAGASGRVRLQRRDLFDVLKQLHQKGKEFNLDLAIATHRLRESVPHGEWMILWEDEENRPFGLGRAERLERIGRCLGTLDSSDRVNLPSALNTLDILRQLDRSGLVTLMHEKRITRKTKVNEAKALLAHYNPDAKRKSPPRFALKSCLAKFHRMCSELISHGTPKENAVAIAAFRQSSEELEASLPDFAEKREENLPGSAGVSPARSPRHARGPLGLPSLASPLAENPGAILQSN